MPAHHCIRCLSSNSLHFPLNSCLPSAQHSPSPITARRKVRVSICISRGGKFTFSNASTAGQNNNATLCTELRGHSPPSTVPGINRTVDKRHFSAAIAARLSRSHLSLRVYRSANWDSSHPCPSVLSLSLRFESTGEETCQRISLKSAELATKQDLGKLYSSLSF
jgi:hypothetical protein